jgi:hypothetical protein
MVEEICRLEAAPNDMPILLRSTSDGSSVITAG